MEPCATPRPRLQSEDGLQACVFGPGCGAFGSCHGGGSPREDLDLSTAEASCRDLVGQASRRLPERVLVVEGDAASSYLMDKLLGLPGIHGGIMPAPPADPLGEGALTAVRGWIEGGATCD